MAHQAKVAAVKMAELLESKLGDLKKREGAGFRLYDSDMGSDQAPASFTNLAAAAAAPSPSSAVASAPVASAFGDTAKAVNPQAALEHKPPAQVLSVDDAKTQTVRDGVNGICADEGTRTERGKGAWLKEPGDSWREMRDGDTGKT